MDRRDFIRISGSVLLAGGLGYLIGKEGLSSASPGGGMPAASLGLRPDQAMVPATHEEKTMAAFADTVIPGPDNDPEGGPGALDTLALNMVYDRFYPFVAFAPLLTRILDQKATQVFELDFADCSFDQRTQVLLAVIEELPIFQMGFQFIKMAFYGGVYNEVGTDYVGFPGPSLGYDDCSYGPEPLCEEATVDGNWP